MLLHMWRKQQITSAQYLFGLRKVVITKLFDPENSYFRKAKDSYQSVRNALTDLNLSFSHTQKAHFYIHRGAEKISFSSCSVMQIIHNSLFYDGPLRGHARGSYRTNLYDIL